VLKNITPGGLEKIRLGNEAAHHGDVIADTSLYSLSQREDHETFTKIYGLDLKLTKLLGKSYIPFLS
jgi:hypothetical protein